MLLLPTASRRLITAMQFLKIGSKQDGDDGALPIPKQLDYTPPPLLGKLLLLSLFVMLSTPLCMTIPTGIDQYSLYSLELLGRVPNLTLLVVLTLIINSISVLLAYQVYCFIWRPETSLVRFVWGPIVVLIRFLLQREENPSETKQNPFKQFAVAVGVPVTIAMLPSLILVNTYTKPYFVIVGLLIAIGLSISGALTHPDVKLDPGVITLWYATAAGGVIVLTGLAVGVTIFYQIAEPIPSTSNLLWGWGHKWAPLGSRENDHVPSTPGDNAESTTQELRYWPNEYPQRQREGNLMFGLSSIAYMVTVLGGYLLYSISVSARKSPVPPFALDQGVSKDVEVEVQLHTQESESSLNENLQHRPREASNKEDPKGRRNATELSISTPSEVGDDDRYGYLEDLLPREWGEEILKLAREEAVEGDDETYLASLGGLERRISRVEYSFLARHMEVEGGNFELKGPLRYADLYVDRDQRVVISRKGTSFEKPRVLGGRGRFFALCILARSPDITYANRRLEDLVRDEVGGAPNGSDIADDLIGRHELPVVKYFGRMGIAPGTKVCYLQELDEKSPEPPVKTV